MLSVIPRARQNDALFQSEPKMFLDKSPHSCFPGYILKRRLDEQPLRETLSPLSRFQTQYDSSRRCKKREQSSPCPPIINMQLQDFFKNYKTSSPRLLPLLPQGERLGSSSAKTLYALLIPQTTQAADSEETKTALHLGDLFKYTHVRHARGNKTARCPPLARTRAVRFPRPNGELARRLILALSISV